MKQNVFLVVVCAVLMALAPGTLFAQSIKIDKKYGNVSKAELEMTVYPLDTSAVALYLYKDVNYSVEIDPGGFAFIKKERERVKILKEAGKEYGDYEEFYSTESTAGESISGIKVTTYNLENGSVVATKMSKDYVFREDYTDAVKRVAFSAQNVKVGSVIETEYTYRTRLWNIDDIFFQFSIPVNWATAEVAVPEYLKVNRISRGFENLEHKMEERVLMDYRVFADKFACYDIPAIRDEKFLYDIDQYRLSVLYQIRSFEIPGIYYKDYTADWQNVDQMIVESNIVRGIKATTRFKDEVAGIAASDRTDEEKIVAIRNLVASRVTWDKKNRLVPGNAAEVVKNGSGSRADLNALTGSALRAAGFDVKPVMVRMRSNGNLVPFHVSLDAYDTFILQVTGPGGQTYYLDAAPSDGYLNVLSDNFLVEKARLLSLDGQGSWVDLRHLCKNIYLASATVRVDAEGLMTGEISEKMFNNLSQTVKRAYGKASDQEEFVDENIEKDHNLTVDRFTISGSDEYTPQVQMAYSFEKQQEVAGDMMYVNLFLLNFHDPSTFKEEVRRVPVDFMYPYRINYTVNMIIPDGYELEELPKPAAYKAQGIKSQAFVQFRQADVNVVSMSFSFVLDSYFAPTEAYKDVRAWYEMLTSMYNTTLVLKKKAV